jgi:hypothetical protein
VPVDILCYYSPHFNRCFHGISKEAVWQKLALSEDRAKDFDILLDYMLTGHVPATFEVEANDRDGLEKCTGFIEYADTSTPLVRQAWPHTTGSSIF